MSCIKSSFFPECNTTVYIIFIQKQNDVELDCSVDDPEMQFAKSINMQACDYT